MDPKELRRLVDAVREARAALEYTIYTGGKSWPDAVATESQIRNTILVSERALCDAILSTDAVEVVEAVRAWQRGEIDDDEMRDVADRLAAKEHSE